MEEEFEIVNFVVWKYALIKSIGEKNPNDDKLLYFPSSGIPLDLCKLEEE